MSLIIKKHTQRQTEKDILIKIFESDNSDELQTLVDMVSKEFESIDIPEEMRCIITKTREVDDKYPRLGMVIFGMWLVPSIQEYLMNNQLVNPRRFVPWINNLQIECENMMHGKHLTLQSFVLESIANYYMNPRQVYNK
tara:strand:- start:79 stop:495 length:417 start_codon:yes stop_codon:yes gene_type:complete